MRDEYTFGNCLWRHMTAQEIVEFIRGLMHERR